MTMDRHCTPCHIGRSRSWVCASAAMATALGRRRAARLAAPIAGALAGLLGMSAGCDLLWHPYIQQLPLPVDAGMSDASAGPADGAEPLLPATCAQASRGGTQPKAMVTLYINNDPSKPWPALCELVGNQLLEYLALPNAAGNFSQYSAGGAAIGQDVRTTYSAVRIDPVSLKVRCGDQRRATSAGKLSHPNSPSPIPVMSMPYGVAMGCNRSANGVAEIDLGGTPFAVAQGAFLIEGMEPIGTTDYSNGDRVVKLTGGGYCGWQDPMPGLNNPFNAASGVELQLVYNP